MATAFRELISDETLPVEPSRRGVAFERSIAASWFGPVNTITFLDDADWGQPLVEPPINARALFKLNYHRWLDDSEFDSLPEMMREHESYQAIVGRGERVLPLIAAEMRRHPSFIFLALEDITGENPVPEWALGNLEATTSAWLAWLQS